MSPPRGVKNSSYVHFHFTESSIFFRLSFCYHNYTKVNTIIFNIDYCNEWCRTSGIATTMSRAHEDVAKTFPHSTSLMTSRGVTTWAWRSIHYTARRGERERERLRRGESGVESSCDTRYSVAAETQTSLSRGISRRVIHGGVNPNEFLLLLFSPPSLLSSFNPRERVKRSKEKATSRFIVLFNFYFRRWL